MTLVLASAGCSPILLDPVESCPEDAHEPTMNAVAMRYGDWLQLPPADANDTSMPPLLFLDIGLAQSPPVADSLALFFSDSPQPCSQPLIDADPFDADGPDEYPHFGQIMLVIPPELHRPGPIDLVDYRISRYEANWKGPAGGGYYGTAAYTSDSTLTILEEDQSTITLDLYYDALNAGPWHDGLYEATYCGPPAPIPPPEPGLAVRGTDLTATVDGTPPDPDTLYLVFGSAAHTCEDPYSPVACTATRRLLLSLPPALQHPGVISLTDPAIQASFQRSYVSGDECQNPPEWAEYHQGPLDGGTIEILSIDANEVQCRVYGSHSESFDEHGTGHFFDGDGLFTATLCP